MCAPAECVGDSWMHNAVFGLGVQIEGHKRAVEEASDDPDGVGTVWNCRYEGFLAEQTLGFVGFTHADTHFTLSCTDEKVVVAFCWPNKACHGAWLQKFVANRLLLSPVATELIDEDNVVGLSDGQARWVRWKSHSAHNVGTISLFGGADGEFVTLLPHVVIEVNYTVRGRNSVSLAVGCPGNGRNFLHSIDGLLNVAPVLDLHLSNLNYKNRLEARFINNRF